MNWLDIGLSFVEGIALIVSPCILPVLPLLLSTSLSGGKMRPYGIITGFVIAFSAFVLLSREIIQALHVSPDVIRDGSLVLLLFFGLVMLSDKLSQKFSEWTQSFADLGSQLSQQNQGGYLSGCMIGALIGLVWTPCAGPILAAVLVQVIRQETDLQGILVTFAFAMGAAVPMLIITLMGRKFLSQMRFVTTNTERIRKAFGVLIIISVAILAYGTEIQNSLVSGAPTEQSQSTGLQHALAQPYVAPEFTGIQEWLNSPPLTMQDLRGKVVLVDFWTYSCINCVRTLPYITEWDKKYRDKGLVIIGVHAPEFEFEKDVGNIKTALEKYGIHYPVAVDNHLDTWSAFKNQYWPAHYLIDKNGQVVYTHFGEGNYDVTENNIRYLLGITDQVTSDNAPSPFAAGQTPETYLGTGRAEHYAGAPELTNDVHDFTLANDIAQHHWSLGGTWQISDEKITASAGAKLQINFKAKKVFLVIGTTDGKPGKVALQLNGEPVGASGGADVKDNQVTITGHALYELVNLPAPGNGLLEISADPGVEFYAFTFGS